MASHARPKSSSARRALLRGGMIATVAGTALGAGSMAAASAAPSTAALPVPGADLETSALTSPGELVDGATYGAGGLETGVGGALGTVTDLQLDPMANTGSDPLDNGVGTQVADFRPVGTYTVTGPVAEGASLSELPLVGPATGLLPG